MIYDNDKGSVFDTPSIELITLASQDGSGMDRAAVWEFARGNCQDRRRWVSEVTWPWAYVPH